MPSFDVISKISYPEFDNALANCLREIGNRFDFKGLHISIERKDKIITTLAPDELKLKQVNELLQIHLIRRKVDPRVIAIKNSESAAGTTIRQVSELEEGCLYTHLRAHETREDLVCRLLLEKKKKKQYNIEPHNT